MRTTPLTSARRLLPLAALILTLPASAQASSLGVAGDGTLVFTGGAGATYLDVDRGADGRITFEPALEDPIGALPAGCEQPGEYEPVACAAPSGIRVVMNEGNDRVTVRAPLGVDAVIEGGAGDDSLSGAYEGGDETLLGGDGNDGLVGDGGNDTVDGGAGDDKVSGGAGTDTVLGGDGADQLKGDSGKAIDADVIDGGAGWDVVEQEWSTVGREGRGLVDVSLGGGGSDGFSGEGDDVKNVEKLATSTGGKYAGTDGDDELYVGGEPTTVEAGGGNDTVYTSYSNDTIDGGAGSDTIRGYSGDDRITGGPGSDTLIGDTLGQTCNVLTCSIYSGNDVIDARDGERDSIDCGLGTDQVLADAADVHVNCEDVQVAGAAAAAAAGGAAGGKPGAGTQQPRAQTGPRATAAARRLAQALAKGLSLKVSGAKAGKLALTGRVGAAKVAACSLKVAKDGTGRCTLRFTKAGKRKLRRAKKATLRITGGGVSTTLTIKR